MQEAWHEITRYSDGKFSMKKVHISKCGISRASFVADVAAARTGSVIHLHPANMQPTPIDHVYRATYESINSKEVWLRINSMVGDNTTVILENPTRYPKITSPKFQHLQMLSHRCGSVYITDIVPFTLSIEYIYCTYALISRGILGYPHYYAWRENYQELVDGVICGSHDHHVVARKVADFSSVDYPCFTESTRRIVEYSQTDQERIDYQLLKTSLFSTETSPTRIVTALADHDHATESRLKCVLSALDGLTDTSVYCNLQSYATKLNKAIRKAGLKASAYSYAKGATSAHNIVYAEAPIVKSYLMLDAESQLNPETITHIRGSSGVCNYLNNRLFEEIGAIDGFTRELYKRREDLHRHKRS